MMVLHSRKVSVSEESSFLSHSPSPPPSSPMNISLGEGDRGEGDRRGSGEGGKSLISFFGKKEEKKKKG